MGLFSCGPAVSCSVGVQWVLGVKVDQNSAVDNITKQ